MRPEKLNYLLSSISSLKGVGPKLEQIINKLGIYKNIHLVWNIPNNILERKFYENIHDAEINSLVTLNLKIIKHEPSRFKRQPYKIKCICGDTNVDLVYFNARHPMLRQMLPTNENRLISGKLEYFRNTFQITHPSHVSALNNNKIIKSKEAVYSLTSGLNQKIMNKLTDQILNNLPNFNEWIESEILNKISWQNSGVNFLFSAWDHLDNSIIYVYSNFGSGFRVPSINERYFHALRPVDSVQDSLLLEGKIMKEVGLKISSIDTESSPRFRGSMSYFNYQYKNKIKSIEYSASPLQFPLNDGSAFISGVELNAELFILNDLLCFRSIYSTYNYSDQLSFPMQPISSLRNSIMVETY